MFLQTVLRILLPFLFCFLSGFCRLVFANVPPDVARFVEIKAAEPSFADVLKIYLQGEHLDGREFRSWKNRIRTAPFLPTLYAGYDHQIKKGASAGVDGTTSISGGIVTVGPDENNYDFDSDLGQAVHVRAVWELSDVAFSRYEFAAASVRQRDVQLRGRAEEALYKIYESRHLYLAQYLASRGGSGGKAVSAYARYLELTDRLDALTGGEYSNRFWKEKNEK
jgi:hypothetical protein